MTNEGSWNSFVHNAADIVWVKKKYYSCKDMMWFAIGDQDCG